MQLIIRDLIYRSPLYTLDAFRGKNAQYTQQNKENRRGNRKQRKGRRDERG